MSQACSSCAECWASWVFQVAMPELCGALPVCVHAVREGPRLLFDKGDAGTCAGGHFSRKALLCSSCRRLRPCSPPCSLKCSLNMEQSRYSEAGGTVSSRTELAWLSQQPWSPRPALTLAWK